MMICYVSATVNIVDMTYSYNNETLYYPNQPKFVYTVLSTIGNVTFYGSFCTAEHGGTHVDAPSHLAPGKWSVDQIPLENLCGPAVVIDITEKAALDRDSCVTVEDILNWESSNGLIPDKSLVIMYSGWGTKWPNVEDSFGNANEDTLNFHFPGFCKETAEFLLSSRSINGIGADTPAADLGKDLTFPSHRLMAKNNKIAIVFIANLDKVPAAGAFVCAMPMKIEGGTAAPARVFAVLG